MKRKLALFLIGVLSLSVTACGQGNKTDQNGDGAEGKKTESGEKPYEGVTLHAAHNLTDSNADSFLAQFQAFEEKYGCEVEVEMLSSDADEMESVLQVRAATGNLPDVWVNSVGAKLDAMSPQENCYDMSGEDWVQERVNDDYLDIVSDDSGAIYGVPSMPSNVAGVFYNKNVYEELNLEIPETWDEFMSNCEKIENESEKIPVMSQYSNASGAQILFLSQYYYVQQENPEFAEEYTAKKIELHDSDAYMRGLEKMYEIWETGYQNDNPLEISWEDAAKVISTGEAVHIFCRTNIMSTVETVNKEAVEDIGFFPLPDEKAESQGVATWMPAAWCINKNSENLELAILLAEFLTTEEAVDAYCEETVPAGAFMLNGIEMPENVSTAVKEAQAWAEKASTPVMEYYCDIKGPNLATILTMVGTGEYTPEQGIAEIESDNAIDAQQKGLEGW